MVTDKKGWFDPYLWSEHRGIWERMLHGLLLKFRQHLVDPPFVRGEKEAKCSKNFPVKLEKLRVEPESSSELTTVVAYRKTCTLYLTTVRTASLPNPEPYLSDDRVDSRRRRPRRPEVVRSGYQLDQRIPGSDVGHNHAADPRTVGRLLLHAQGQIRQRVTRPSRHRRVGVQYRVLLSLGNTYTRTRIHFLSGDKGRREASKSQTLVLVYAKRSAAKGRMVSYGLCPNAWTSTACTASISQTSTPQQARRSCLWAALTVSSQSPSYPTENGPPQMGALSS